MESESIYYDEFYENKNVCSFFYKQVVEPQITELEKKQNAFLDVIDIFLKEKGYSFKEFLDYLEKDYVPQYDLDFLRDLYVLIEIRINIKDLMRDYYDSVFSPEDFYETYS